MSIWSPDVYLAAWRFAAEAHRKQTLPGSKLPYIVHIAAVSMEVTTALARREARGEGVDRPDLAVQCALLHDVAEDTPVSAEEISREFGPAVASGVLALTKDPGLEDGEAAMRDSLERIRTQPIEVWMVKLADRITNLQPPPHYWSVEKIRAYHREAGSIHDALASACPVLGPRLAEKIEAYERFG